MMSARLYKADQMKVVLSTDLHFGYMFIPLIMKRTFYRPCTLKENLDVFLFKSICALMQALWLTCR